VRVTGGGEKLLTKLKKICMYCFFKFSSHPHNRLTDTEERSGGGQLGTIDLSDNDLCTADAEALTAACRVNRTLEELILYGNDDIDDDATEALEDVLSDMSRLE
jgi:hypothetical protein